MSRVKGQQEIDWTRRARAEDPSTSHAAAARVADFGKAHHAVILAALSARGPATIYELQDRTGIDHVAVARRMSELLELRQVHRTGGTRAGPTGRQCAVWAGGDGPRPDLDAASPQPSDWPDPAS